MKKGFGRTSVKRTPLKLDTFLFSEWYPALRSFIVYASREGQSDSYRKDAHTRRELEFRLLVTHDFSCKGNYNCLTNQDIISRLWLQEPFELNKLDLSFSF